jgi:hypothetical protein
MIGFLEEESVFDAQRLLSYTVVPIIAGLCGTSSQTKPDQLGSARHLLRKFLSYTFQRSQYEQFSTSNVLQDSQGL